ncbi:N-6 DNA methylase [Propionibacterium freudenreichii]|nr:N-6 DNA methylase [Propionibacterium freudenreichii]
MLQADIRSFILTAGLNVTDAQMADVNDVGMEAQVGTGTRWRIDIETGTTVIEVKKDLSKGSTLADGEAQIGRYLQLRSRQTGARYLGVLTDGHQWRLYVPDPDGVGALSSGEPLIVSSAADTETLRYWLGTVLATVDQIKPFGEAIVRAMGAKSPAHAADHATLRALYRLGAARPEIRLKRELWAKLLRTALGSTFDDDEDLFVDHTLLVMTAEIIAHAVIGFDISLTGGLTAPELVSGSRFREAEISGVVEDDFFDWPVNIEGGAQFVRSLASRLSRFDWSRPDHDALKHLYEAVISQQTREALGEYYTPDWLAEAMVADVDQTPLEDRVLDPSCGSGTFVFHAVRTYLAAADQAGVPNGKALADLTSHVMGMDVHPVAVTLARVTYLLAIGTERLSADDRGPLAVPVFLGDSMQWEEHRDLYSEDAADAVIVSTAGDELVSGGGGTLFGDDLIFPRTIVSDTERFDRIISQMADAAKDTSETHNKTLVAPILNRNHVSDPEQRHMLEETFSTMRSLHQTGRDHIWGYYVRNLIRPVSLTRPDHRASVLIGNPPWLRYNKMTGDMQRRYLDMSKQRNLLSGPLGASARDLSTLFVVRAIELYAAPGGRFSFVMPWGTLTRKPHDGFRSGEWSIGTLVVFTTPWDLDAVSRATGFPMTSCVVHGHLADSPARMPATAEKWTLTRQSPTLSWDQIQTVLTRQPGDLRALSNVVTTGESPYKKRFRNGAIIYPRMLFFVEEENAGPLGAGAGRVRVRSRRTTSEKPPWKQLDDLTGTVERKFLHPVHLGETLLPYRMADPLTAVVPVSISDPSHLTDLAEIDTYPGLSKWWGQVESTWRAHRVKTEKKPLVERVDYSGQLTAQLPLDYSKRVVYSASGNTLTAARIDNPEPLIEHKLYWAPVRSDDEGRYLVGILNSATLLRRVQPLQARGLFGPRDFDKHVFQVPFDTYDPNDPDHLDLVVAVKTAEQLAARVDVSGAGTFQTARKLIRIALDRAGITERIEESVNRVLPEIQ